jgi:pimeloyl-ACP methyl ester carboxylesterase
MWDGVRDALVASGHRVIAFDQRGYGESSAPAGRGAYAIDTLVEDATAVIADAHLDGPLTVVGHDWGAIVGWVLCLSRPELVARHVAVSVGHPTSYRAAGLGQKARGWYIGSFQLVGLAEWVYSRRDFALLRALLDRHPDQAGVVRDLSRPGRFTAGLNWYRRNLVAIFTRRWADCTVPTLGIWSSGDRYLVEGQMTGSRARMAAEWEYVRIDGAGHWVPMEQPQRVAELIAGWAAGGLPADSPAPP